VGEPHAIATGCKVKSGWHQFSSADLPSPIATGKGKKDQKDAAGRSIVHVKAGGRTSAIVPSIQKVAKVAKAAKAQGNAKRAKVGKKAAPDAAS
jgi:hypothetical protein